MPNKALKHRNTEAASLHPKQAQTFKGFLPTKSSKYLFVGSDSLTLEEGEAKKLLGLRAAVDKAVVPHLAMDFEGYREWD